MTIVQFGSAVARLNEDMRSESYAFQIRAMRDDLRLDPATGAELRRYSDRRISDMDDALCARGRNLGLALLQLAHLLPVCAAADLRAGGAGDPFAVLFALEKPVRARFLRAELAAALDGAAACDADGIEISCRGAEAAYRISWGRAELLIALTEFMYMIDPEVEGAEACRDALDAAAATPLIHASVKAAGNRLSAALNQALNTLLDERPVRERFGRILDFLEARAEDGEIRIDDEAALAFWEAEAGAWAALPEAARERRARETMRTFESVHHRFVSLLAALKAGEAKRSRGRARDVDDPALALDQNRSIYDEAAPDRPAGEIARLDEPEAARLALLTQRQRHALRIVDADWREAGALPLSALRSSAMGAVQNRIIQALRDGKDVAPLLSPDPEAVYAEQYEEWRLAAEEIATLRLAAAHVVAWHADRDLHAFAEPARKAWDKVKRRRAFKTALEDSDAAIACGDAISPLVALSSLLQRLREALPEDPGPQCAHDAARFGAVFRNLYS